MRKYLLMAGREYILLAALLFTCAIAARSQNPDKFLKILPTLKGKERIDCMIELVIHYSRQNGYNGNDSLSYYLPLIYDEASKLGYKHAIAFSLLGLHPFPDSIRLQDVKKAIVIAEELNDYEVLGLAYDDLQYVLWEINNQIRTPEQIKLMERSVYYFQKAGDTLGEAMATHRLCFIGNVEGFEYCKKSIQLSRQIRSSADWEEFGRFLYFRSLDVMSGYYADAGDYTTALTYMKQANQEAQAYSNGSWGLEDGISSLFNKMGQYDSSIYYLQMRAKREKGVDPYMNTLLGKTYLLQKDYEGAQQLFEKAIDSITRMKLRYPPTEALLGLAKCVEIKKEYKSALLNAKKAFDISQTNEEDSKYTMDICELLARLYHQTGNNDSAYRYLQRYTILKDSATNRQYLWKFNLKLYEYKKEAEEAKKEARLGFLDRDNKIKEEKLKQEAQLKKFLIIGLLLLILIGVFIFRTLTVKRKSELQKQKLESAKKQAELQQQAAELEMQALRAQMNPHFIFNCLSSINRIILRNETQAASDYLTRFSRLIRMVLINSQRSMIPLEDELQMLRLYLDMERMRFKNSFDYRITFANTIDEGAVLVPPLLLQPFCENAIWHGMMQKEGQGHLQIELSMEENILSCMISDDGIGREKAAELKTKSAEKEKSMGLTITAQRLALLNKNTNVETFYTIEDMLDENENVAGTKVVLKIAYHEMVKEIV